MSRLLAFLLLVACIGDPPPLDASFDSSKINAWLDQWVETRRCVVADAENIEVGVSIAMLLGHRCDAQLKELTSLTESRSRGVVDAMWKESVSERALAVEAADKLALELGHGVGRVVLLPRASPPLRVLAAPRPLGLTGYNIDFGGGVIHDYQTTRDVVIDAKGMRRYEFDGRPRYPTQMAYGSSNDVEYAGSAQAGHQRVVVWAHHLSSAIRAYEIDMSSDAGKHWTTIRAPVGTRYKTHWQDPQSRAIEVLVHDGDKSTVHRITAECPNPQIRTVAGLTVYSSEHCMHGGRRWSLVDNLFVAPFGEKPLMLGAWRRLEGIDCRDDSVLITTRNSDGLERCQGGRCESVFSAPNSFAGRGAFLGDGRWVYVAVHGEVVGVWVEGVAAPSFYRLSHPRTLKELVVSGNTPVLVFQGMSEPYEVVSL